MDVDGELERLRAETRHRLEGEKELEDKLAEYELAALKAAAPPPAAKAKPAAEERSEKPSLEAQLAKSAAGSAAKKAAREVSSLSTPKLLGALLALVFGVWILERLLAPIVALAVLAIVLILGWRFLSWLTSDEKDDDDDPAR